MAQLFSRHIGRLFKLNMFSTDQGKNRQYNNLKLVNRNITSTPKYMNSVCWKCGKNRKQDFFCENCQIIQKPPETENYFSIFGIQEKFTLDPVQLTNKFRKFQSLVHPDKFSNKSSEERNISEEYSSLLNKAYSYLQTPLKRAEYLLNLKGETISESDTINEPTFLMEMMTLNEEVEEAKNSPKQLKMLNVKNKKELNQLIQLIDDSFQSGNLSSVKQNIIKMKYFISLGDRINHYLRELGVTD